MPEIKTQVQKGQAFRNFWNGAAWESIAPSSAGKGRILQESIRNPPSQPSQFL